MSSSPYRMCTGRKRGFRLIVGQVITFFKESGRKQGFRITGG